MVKGKGRAASGITDAVCVQSESLFPRYTRRSWKTNKGVLAGVINKTEVALKGGRNGRKG